MRQVLLILVLVAACASWAAAEETIRTRLDIDQVSKYVWRGLVANADPALQPSLTLAHKCGTSLNVWASMDTTNIGGNESNTTEIDYTLSHSWPASGGSWSAGLIDYEFPNTSFRSTAEAYVGFSSGGGLSPSLTVYYDFDEADGVYAAAGVLKNFALGTRGRRTACSVSAKVGYGTSSYNHYYCGLRSGGFADLLLSASATLPVGRNWAISPSLSYSRMLDGDMRDMVRDPDNIVMGIRLTTAF